jgi:enoyl-CoA hydratase/carnithine racemase
VKAIVVTGSGGNFCSGGDVFEIIEPLTKMNTVELLDFTRMTGEVVKSMRGAPQPIIAAIDGVCAGAGAIIAMASDIRIGTSSAKVAFLFNRVGLGGCDMGACAILPRIVGQGRAAELLFTGRSMGGEEAERMGFFNRLAKSDSVLAEAQKLAHDLANGPTFGNAMTKRMLEMEWAMSVETAVEAEAVAQALCMETEDFARAYRPLPPSRSRCSRAIEMSLDDTLSWPFFDDGHRRFAEALVRWADATLPKLPHDDVDAACRARVAALAEAGFLKVVVPAEHGGLHRGSTCARSASPARSWRSAMASPISPSPCRGWAPPRFRCFGSAELKAHLSAAGARRPRDCRLCAVGAGGGLRRGGRWPRLPQPMAVHISDWTVKKPGYRTGESPTITWCSREPARRWAPAGFRPSWSMPTHLGSPLLSASR